MSQLVKRRHEFWVDELSISDGARRHIWADHEVTDDQARHCVRWVEGLTGDWAPDEWGRLRAVIDVTIRGLPGILVMYPAEGEPWGPGALRWRLRTVYPL